MEQVKTKLSRKDFNKYLSKLQLLWLSLLLFISTTLLCNEYLSKLQPQQRMQFNGCFIKVKRVTLIQRLLSVAPTDVGATVD